MMINEKLENKRVRYIFLGLMALFFIATRLYRLDIIPFGPHGVHVDEAGAMYDAICIKNWGVDQFLIKYPPYFRGLSGTGQNALYTYLASIIFRFFNVSIFSFRLVAVICAAGAFFAMFFLAEALFMKKTYVFVSLGLMTIMPVFMMSEHWGLESYLFLSFSIISMSFTLNAILREKQILFILAGIFWGLTLYTYAISWIVVPLFLITTLIYLFYVQRIRISQIFSLALPAMLFGIPLIIQLFVMTGVLSPFSLPFMDFLPTESFRNKSIGLSYILTNLKHTTYVLLCADDQIYNSNVRFGLMYYVAIPFLFFGIICVITYAVRSLRKKEFDCWTVILVFYLAGRLVSLITLEPNTNRMAHLYLPMLLFTVLGINWIIDRIKFKKAAAIVIFAAFGMSFIIFAKYFYSWSGFGLDTKASIMCAPTQIGETLREIEQEYGNTHTINVIANDGYANPLMMAIFTETSPYDFKEERINGCINKLPDELDLSGGTVYLIDNEIHHITDYLETEGFTADRDRCEGFAVVYK